MQEQDLLRYVEHPESVDQRAIQPLQQLVKDFPYFEGAHILLSLASRKWDASVYQQSLRRTAISVTNRAHLFDLLHRTESMAAETPASVAAGSVTGFSAKDAKHELDILKAAEVSLEPAAPALSKPLTEQPAELEKEIARQVVTSFVEKEIIKTPELHKPPVAPVEKPGSFGDWLTFLKKNNGQPYRQIEEQVNRVKAKQDPAPQEPPREPAEPQKADSGGAQESRKLKNKAIIDRIIEKNPGLIRTREEQKFYAPEARAKESLLENEHLMTETLARIYALQGNTGKAVRAYEILSLKYPQKSAYFATLIQQLKNNTNQ